MILGRAQRARIRQIARGRSEEGLRVLEGAKAVRDALGLGVVAELWLRRDLEAAVAAELEAAAGAQDVPVGWGAGPEFDGLGDVVTPQGVLALVRDAAWSLDRLLEREGALLWLDGVQDPGNVGAVVRVAAGFGFAGLLVGAGSADPLGLKALRASAGLALRLPFARGAASAIAEGLSTSDRPVWALERAGEDVFGVEDPPANLVLAVGAEGPGLGPEARSVAVRRVGVSLAPGVDSLNAAVAAGIVAAWWAHRRCS